MKPNDILASRYQILEQLSKKAGRQTFLAQDLQSQELVIIKILRFDVDFQWDDLKLFERETSTLRNLEHPAIPRYLDYFEVEEPNTKGFALVQTYIDAPSLETAIRNGRKFSEAEVMEIADRMLSILIYLHEQLPPVIHRDIKPSNILIANRSAHGVGDIYLVDFGSVQTLASKEGGTITIVGSYGYIPLEQFGGQTVAASDLYSLGMTIVYLVTGNHPTELRRINGQVEFAADINNQFRRWLDKMIQPYLDKRFDSAKNAQKSLKSEDGSYGDLLHLKPIDSQVSLYRDRENLRIVFPVKSTDNNVFSSVLVTFFFGWFAIGLIHQLLRSELSVFTFEKIVLFLITFIASTLFLSSLYNTVVMVISGIRSIRANRHSELTIDGQSVSHRIFYLQNIDYFYENNFLGYPKKKPTETWGISRPSIGYVVYNPGYTIKEYVNSKDDSKTRGIDKIPPDLYIVRNSNKVQKSIKYAIGEGLSREELWWLGKEISDFLNLELQVIYPTKQIVETEG